jgi:hypothetical protein
MAAVLRKPRKNAMIRGHDAIASRGNVTVANSGVKQDKAVKRQLIMPRDEQAIVDSSPSQPKRIFCVQKHDGYSCE